MNKLWYIQMVEYYTAIQSIEYSCRKNRVAFHRAKSQTHRAHIFLLRQSTKTVCADIHYNMVNPANITLSERSQTQKATHV